MGKDDEETTEDGVHSRDLSGKEVEALRHLFGTAGIPIEDTLAFGVDEGTGADGPIIMRYNLVGDSGPVHDELPGLELLHERFCRELAAESRRRVGGDGIFTAQSMVMSKFAQTYANLEAPTALIIADCHGLGCSIIIAMEPDLMLHFLDLMMGGGGGPVKLSDDMASRGFTSTERGLIGHITKMFSNALSTAWREVAEVSLELVRVATDPRHAALYAPDDLMVELPVTVEWGDIVGIVQLIMPMVYLRPYEEVLSRTATPEHILSEGQLADVMRDNISPIPVTLTAVLGSTEMSLREMLRLDVGDVLRLNADPDEPVLVTVEDIPKYLGRPTVQHGNLAVTLIDHAPKDA